MGSNPIIVTQIYHYGGMNTQQSKKLPPNKVGIWVQIPLVVHASMVQLARHNSSKNYYIDTMWVRIPLEAQK